MCLLRKVGLKIFGSICLHQGLNSGPLGEGIKVKKKGVEYMAK